MILNQNLIPMLDYVTKTKKKILSVFQKYFITKLLKILKTVVKFFIASIYIDIVNYKSVLFLFRFDNIHYFYFWFKLLVKKKCSNTGSLILERNFFLSLIIFSCNIYI